MKKILKYLIAGMLVCFSMGLVACTEKNGTTNNGETQGVVEREEGIINGFETIDDLYKTRFNMLDSTFTDNYKATINTDKAYVKTGNGSVRFEYHHSATNPGFLFYGETIKGLNMLELKEASLQMYNACEHEIIVFFHLHRKDGKTIKSSPMYTETFALTPNAWTELVLPINNVVMQYNGANVHGFGVEFKLSPSTHSGEDEKPCILYMDDLAIEYGVTLTQEDEDAKVLIDQIIDKIAKLPSGITVESESQILEVYTMYTNLPDKYKGAVTNYELYTTAVNKFVSELNKTSTEEETTILFMDKFIGSSQFRESPTFDEMATLGYTMDEHFGDEVGSTYIQFYGEEETKADGQAYAGWFWSTSAVLSDYDYVEFAVKNATDQQITFWWTWGGTTQINPSDEWQVLTYPIEVFATDVKEFECVPSNHVGPIGKFYFSAIKAYSGRIEGLTDPALSGDISISGAATKTTTTSGTKIKATADGNVTISINKSLETLTMGENAYLNVNASKARKLSALNAAGETLYSISLEKGWNTIVFTADVKGYTLNDVTAFKMDGATNGEELVLGDFLLTRPSNDNTVRVLMQSKYVDNTNVYALAQYLSAFDALTKSDVTRLEAEYATAKSDAAAWKQDLHTAFVSLIQATSANFDATQARTVKLVYEMYQGMAGVTTLTAEQEAKAENIIEQWKLLPQTLWSPNNVDDVAMFSIEARPGDKHANTMSATVGGMFVTETDATYGTVLKIVDSQYYMATLRINYQHGLADSTTYWRNKLAGLDKVVFYIYNPSVTGVRFMISNSNGGLHATVGENGSSGWVTLQNGWNEIVVEASKWIDSTGFPSETAYYMYFNGKDNASLNGVQFKFSEIVGYTEAGYQKHLADREAEKLAKAQKAVQYIADLPAVNTLTYGTPELNAVVAEIQEAYALLGANITNYAMFEAFYAVYKDLPTMLLDVDADSNKFSTGFVEGYEGYYANRVTATISKVTDATYGNVVKYDVTEFINTGMATFNFNAGVTDLYSYWSEKLAGLDKAVFYFYNGYSSEIRLGLATGGNVTISGDIAIAANSWGMYTIDVETFLLGLSTHGQVYASIRNCGNPNVKGFTFMISNFVGYTNAQYTAAFSNN